MKIIRRAKQLEKELGELEGHVAKFRSQMKKTILDNTGFKREIRNRALSQVRSRIVVMVRQVTRFTPSTWNGRLTGA